MKGKITMFDDRYKHIERMNKNLKKLEDMGEIDEIYYWIKEQRDALLKGANYTVRDDTGKWICAMSSLICGVQKMSSGEMYCITDKYQKLLKNALEHWREEDASINRTSE